MSVNNEHEMLEPEQELKNVGLESLLSESLSASFSKKLRKLELCDT